MIRRLYDLIGGKSDKRNENRVKLDLATGLVHRGKYLKAEYRDFSHQGLRIKVIGDICAETGERVEFTMGNYEFHAKIIWIDKTDEGIVLGLQVEGYRWLSSVVSREGNG